jgi:hypothetical protein
MPKTTAADLADPVWFRVFCRSALSPPSPNRIFHATPSAQHQAARRQMARWVRATGWRLVTGVWLENGLGYPSGSNQYPEYRPLCATFATFGLERHEFGMLALAMSVEDIHLDQLPWHVDYPADIPW